MNSIPEKPETEGVDTIRIKGKCTDLGCLIPMGIVWSRHSLYNINHWPFFGRQTTVFEDANQTYSWCHVKNPLSERKMSYDEGYH